MKLPFTLRKPPTAAALRQESAEADTTAAGQTAIAPTQSTALQNLKKGGKKPAKGKKKRVVAAVLVVALLGGAAVYMLYPKNEETAATYTEETAAKQDIQNVLSATGTLEPLNSYDVTALVTGDVLQCTFDEGDVVEKGQLLYEIDSTDVEDSIEKSKLSLEQSQLSYQSQLEDQADLTVKSKTAGVITEVNVEKGDSVSNGTVIATVRDSSTMTITLPFNSADVQKFYTGETATVTMDGSFETLTGTVTEIDGADTVLEGNQLVRYVEIRVTNPGALSTSASGAATINGIASNAGASFAYNEEKEITAETSGEVTWVIAKGTQVSSSTTVAKLASTDLQTSIRNAEISLESSQISLQNTVDSLQDYEITAPIAGTIVTKNAKVGDTLDSTNGSNTLAVIYDMSKLTFDIALDELDINQVSVGQEVEITVDALDGEEFTGYITKVSVAGTTENGATTYPVTVEIENPPSDLFPGMNVNASIIVAEASDVVAIPVAAVQRGDKVYVKDSDSTSADTQTADTAADATAKAGANDKNAENAMNEIPEGYHAVKVETGISDDSYIEVTSGIAEGDIVYVPQATRDTSSDTQQNQDQMMMGGGMGGEGGPPSGGGGGGGMP